MVGNWRIHGKEFPALLFIAAYTLTGASFQRMPKLEDFAGGKKEVDGFEVWQALRDLYIWFKGRCESFPFSKTAVFLEPRDVDVPETASYLLEMTSLCHEGNLPAEQRHTANHYGKCEFHLGCYTDMIRAFLDHLYLGTDLDETALGRQVLLANELQRFFKGIAAIMKSVPAIELISHFVSSLEPTKRKNFRSFLEKKNPFPANFDEVLAKKWIDEFLEEAGIRPN